MRADQKKERERNLNLSVEMRRLSVNSSADAGRSSDAARRGSDAPNVLLPLSPRLMLIGFGADTLASLDRFLTDSETTVIAEAIALK